MIATSVRMDIFPASTLLAGITCVVQGIVTCAIWGKDSGIMNARITKKEDLPKEKSRCGERRNKMWLFLWETPEGERKWETVRRNQAIGFLEKLINDRVHPATVMACVPLAIRWVWPEYHKGNSEVNLKKINEEIYGTEPIESKHTAVDVPIEKPKPETKWGWLAPDGRFFKCDYGGHSYLASKIVGDIQKVANPERHLEEIGWAKVLSGVAGRRYAIGMGTGKKLTDAQLKTLQREGLDTAYGISYFL